MAKKNSFWWIIVFGICFVFSSMLVFFKSKKVEANERINIVCSNFPIYDWTRHIIGSDSDSIVISMTQKNGVNFHSFVPSDFDVTQIENCSLFVCIGTENFILEKGMPGCKVLDLGMEAKKTNPELYEKDGDHIWLSVKNAEKFSRLIAREIIALDFENKEKYEKNLAAYLNQLVALDEEYAETFGCSSTAEALAADGLIGADENALASAEGIGNDEKALASAKGIVNDENALASVLSDELSVGKSLKPLILCDKNPFLWLFSDYGVKFYAALPQCNGMLVEKGPLEKFVGAETVDFLTEKMDENDVRVLFKLDSASDKFAYQVIKNSKNPFADIFALDTMHGVTLNEALKGKSYVKVMRANLLEMKKAL